ncbi:kinase-like domain-containing protein [Xylaria palmicola]|nr:kinase-like domain-containing protein [Xylaria palmicola]
MEVCHVGSACRMEGDRPIFDHTKIILRGVADEFFYARSNEELCMGEVDVDALDTVPIARDIIWPLAEPELTLAPEPLPATCYLKRPNLIFFEPDAETYDFKETTLGEVKACELLRKHPHPNIAPYFGCVVKNGTIRGLVFKKYSVTLSEMLENGVLFDKDHCLDGIETGVRHMHDLGLVHNDLNPSNIMMDGDTPVIIDFDSCKPEGEELGTKGGTWGYSLDQEEYSKRDNDIYSLSKIREAVMLGKDFNS